jgi:hypothetical protein
LTKETKLNDEVRTASHAAQLLDNEVFKSAIAAVEGQYLNAMLSADEKDDLGRFRYAEAIKVVRMVSRHLRSAVENGKLSTAELDTMQGRRNRFF